MNISNILRYLSEELVDIPARPDNIHYTNMESLPGILKKGLLGNTYSIKSYKHRPGKFELCTVRNHKNEKNISSLSDSIGGIKIELFTNRILSGLRGVKRAPIAELPIDSNKELNKKKDIFKTEYGFDLPENISDDKFFLKDYNRFNYRKCSNQVNKVDEWVKKNVKTNDASLRDDILNSICDWYRTRANYNSQIINRENEERFILDRPIPVKPEFMRITIMNYDDNDLDYIYDSNEDREFYNELMKHSNVFVKNENYERLMNNLKYDLESENET